MEWPCTKGRCGWASSPHSQVFYHAILAKCSKYREIEENHGIYYWSASHICTFHSMFVHPGSIRKVQTPSSLLFRFLKLLCQRRCAICLPKFIPTPAPNFTLNGGRRPWELPFTEAGWSSTCQKWRGWAFVQKIIAGWSCWVWSRNVFCRLSPTHAYSNIANYITLIVTKIPVITISSFLRYLGSKLLSAEVTSNAARMLHAWDTLHSSFLEHQNFI